MHDGESARERIAHYRDKAAKLREWAERPATKDIRDEILKLAADYDKLADGVEQTDRRRTLSF